MNYKLAKKKWFKKRVNAFNLVDKTSMEDTSYKSFVHWSLETGFYIKCIDSDGAVKQLWRDLKTIYKRRGAFGLFVSCRKAYFRKVVLTAKDREPILNFWYDPLISYLGED
jgi:hypothetical protein